MFNLLGWSGCFNWYVNRIIILSKYITVKILIFRCLNIKMVVIIICFGSRGSQVRILVPRHRKPRSYSKCDSFFYLHKIMVEMVVLLICFNRGFNRCFNQHQKRDVAVVKWRPWMVKMFKKHLKMPVVRWKNVS